MSIRQVKDFNEKFGVGVQVNSQERYVLTDEAGAYRDKFLREEVQEFFDAWIEGDAVRMLDALLDTVYVALGTAVMMGVTPEQWDEAFLTVHLCNMAKERAASPEQSKRGTSLDVIKPAGWVGPEEKLRAILFPPHATKDDGQ